MDVDQIAPGVDFGEVIEDAVASTHVLLVVIGARWLTVEDARGTRRLDEPEDWVHMEIEAAFRPGVRVIPVRVDNAQMPSSDELPEPLAPLARRNAVEIRHTSWRSDIDRLIRAIEEIERQHGGSEGVRATSDEKQDPDPREHAAEDQPAELLHPMFRVRAVPVLEVVPTRIDFGRTKLGQHHAATVDVANAGSGELKWRYRKKGDFFDLKRSGDRLTVTLAYLAGKHRGSISIQSNGGETAVEVLAQIAWPLA